MARSTPMSDKLTVIYNDTCPICSREVNGYRKVTERAGLDVDYAGWSDTDLARFGLDRDTAAKRFHVQTDGTLLSGVDAFAALWSRMPGFRWLARFVTVPVVRPVARFVYDRIAAPLLFALHRRRERAARRAGQTSGGRAG